MIKKILTRAFRIKRGHEAYELLQSEVFKQAVENVKTELLNDIINSAPQDSGARERAYTAHQAVGKVCDKLASYYQDAKILTERAAAQEK